MITTKNQAWKTRPASSKQIAFATRLLSERNWHDGLDGADYERAFDLSTGSGKFLASGEASELIDALLAIRPNGAPAAKSQPAQDGPQQEATPGYYTLDEDVYVVVENKAKTHVYAKRLVATPKMSRDLNQIGHTYPLTTDDGQPIYHVSWDYSPGSARRFVGATPLTVEEAARLGHLYGHCIICTRELTDPKSVEAGIGPVCAKRLH